VTGIQTGLQTNANVRAITNVVRYRLVNIALIATNPPIDTRAKTVADKSAGDVLIDLMVAIVRSGAAKTQLVYGGAPIHKLRILLRSGRQRFANVNHAVMEIAGLLDVAGVGFPILAVDDEFVLIGPLAQRHCL
jgi:hypothetical protein